MRFPTTILLLFACLSFIHGQATDCPTIVVVGADGFSNFEEPLRYSVQVNPPERAAGLSYLWKVYSRNGETGMVRGQGTTQIEVPFRGEQLTVSVVVIGLPSGCTNVASETTHVDFAPQAIKLKELAGKLTKYPKTAYSDVARQLVENPTARLAVIVYPGKGGTVQAKRSFLESQFGKQAKPQLDRVDFATSSSQLDKVVFWLVPAGADMPKP